jgi:hypothetical protein
VREVCQGGRAFVVAGAGLQAGPLLEQGAVEAFDLAVGLRPVDARAIAGCAEVGQCLPPGEALAVGPGMVGQRPFDAQDAVGGEEGRRPSQEAGANGGLLVAVYFAAGEACAGWGIRPRFLTSTWSSPPGRSRS